MLSDSIRFSLPNLAATQQLAHRLASLVRPPMTIALSGSLGAGKTQWVRDFCEAQGVAAQLVTSPTYVLLQRYRGDHGEIYHFDFYRLERASQVWDLGFDELQEQAVINLVEWADKFPEVLPSDYVELQLHQQDHDQRQALLTAHGPNAAQILRQLQSFKTA